MSTDFTKTELHRIREMLVQRYRKEIEIQLADCEISLDMGETEPASRPTVFWHERGASFVVFKISPFRFRSQFFCSPHEQYGTGIDEFNDLDQCVAALLQAQSDHEREHRGMHSPTENTQSLGAISRP